MKRPAQLFGQPLKINDVDPFYSMGGNLQLGGDAFNIIFGLSAMLLGMIQLIFPHAAIRLRNRFGNIKRFDGAHWIYSSRHAALFVRSIGLVFIFIGYLILGM
ncbi:MAG: hypothetical protein LH481_03210 [Burkholderiales bacterium]|nr:hypothetical protein [Burkholderiales bacterium]